MVPYRYPVVPQDAPSGQGPCASRAEGVSLAHSAGQMRIQVPPHLIIKYQTTPQSQGDEAVLESQ